MTRRSAIEQAARAERLSAIGGCRRGDQRGWRPGPARTPVDPAIRCTHNSALPPPASGRDITEPIHKSELFSESIHQSEAER